MASVFFDYSALKSEQTQFSNVDIKWEKHYMLLMEFPQINATLQQLVQKQQLFFVEKLCNAYSLVCNSYSLNY